MGPFFGVVPHILDEEGKEIKERVKVTLCSPAHGLASCALSMEIKTGLRKPTSPASPATTCLVMVQSAMLMATFGSLEGLMICLTALDISCPQPRLSQCSLSTRMLLSQLWCLFPTQ